MKANHRTERFLTLELNENEIAWLTKELKNVKREPIGHSPMRTAFLDALTPPDSLSGTIPPIPPHSPVKSESEA